MSRDLLMRDDSNLTIYLCCVQYSELNCFWTALFDRSPLVCLILISEYASTIKRSPFFSLHRVHPVIFGILIYGIQTSKLEILSKEAKIVLYVETVIFDVRDINRFKIKILLKCHGLSGQIKR
jgi:hypothetical protein